MTVSIWQANNNQPIRECDLLIVGAGLAGCAAAYFAREMGLYTLITEKADIALGASGRNAGFMITGIDQYVHEAIAQYGEEKTWELWNISRETIAFWKHIIDNAEGRVSYNPCGSMLLAESEAESQSLEHAATAMQALHLPIRYHTSDPLNRGFFGAIEQPEDGSVQPVELVHELLRQSGAEIIVNNELYAIEQTAPDVVTVSTRRYIIKARHVLLCTNAYSALIDPYFEDKVIPTRAQVLVTEPLTQSAIPTMGYSNYGYMYYRMTFDGRFLLGGARHHYKALENNTTEDKLNALVQAKLDDYLRQWFPDVTAPIARRWAGIMGFSVDGLPLVGTLPERPRVGFAVGFTGHGLSMSAMTVKRALHLLLHGEHAGAVDAQRLMRQPAL